MKHLLPVWCLPSADVPFPEPEKLFVPTAPIHDWGVTETLWCFTHKLVLLAISYFCYLHTFFPFWWSLILVSLCLHHMVNLDTNSFFHHYHRSTHTHTPDSSLDLKRFFSFMQMILFSSKTWVSPSTSLLDVYLMLLRHT